MTDWNSVQKFHISKISPKSEAGIKLSLSEKFIPSIFNFLACFLIFLFQFIIIIDNLSNLSLNRENNLGIIKISIMESQIKTDLSPKIDTSENTEKTLGAKQEENKNECLTLPLQV